MRLYMNRRYFFFHQKTFYGVIYYNIHRKWHEKGVYVMTRKLRWEKKSQNITFQNMYVIGMWRDRQIQMENRFIHWVFFFVIIGNSVAHRYTLMKEKEKFCFDIICSSLRIYRKMYFFSYGNEYVLNDVRYINGNIYRQISFGTNFTSIAPEMVVVSKRPRKCVG